MKTKFAVLMLVALCCTGAVAVAQGPLQFGDLMLVEQKAFALRTAEWSKQCLAAIEDFETRRAAHQAAAEGLPPEKQRPIIELIQADAIILQEQLARLGSNQVAPGQIRADMLLAQREAADKQQAVKEAAQAAGDPAQDAGDPAQDAASAASGPKGGNATPKEPKAQQRPPQAAEQPASKPKAPDNPKK